MTELTRRALFAGASAGAAGLLLPLPASAEAPLSKAQVPSAYRYKVGAYEVTAISDGARTFPLPGGFVRNQPQEKVKEVLRDAFLDPDRLTIPFTALLVNTGTKLVLIDTGNGPSADGAGPVGLLQGTLAAIGVDPKAIDAVVISHFHADHINGLLTREGTPAFPNAQVLVPEKEWAFWMDDGRMSRAPDGLMNAFQNVRRVFAPFAGKVERYAWDKEIVPGLEAVGTPGHTPGHTSFQLESDFDTLFIQSDITNIPALFARNPGWHVMFDMDPAAAEAVRRATYDRLAADRTKVAGYHFPFPGAAHLKKADEGYLYVPVSWNPLL